LSDFKFKVKLGDLVELNAAGKNREWLYRAKDAVGVVIGLYEPTSAYDYKDGSVIVRWANMTPKRVYWELDFTNRKIPVNCIKKVRRKKK
jgi:hypothetical protein